jgi:hypothetical protein
MTSPIFFREAWAELDDGSRVYPYAGSRGEKRGLYSVNFTNDNSKFIGVGESELRAMFVEERFRDRGVVRMLSPDAKPGSQRNAFAPTHYLGSPISTVTRSPVAVRLSEPALFSTELSDSTLFTEGSVQQVLVNRFERSPAARAACLAHHGYSCKVCGLNFEDRYGVLGHGFIHVHHLARLADIRSEYVVDPIRDLVPVCPNCHAMLHQSDPPLLPKELCDLLSDG